MTGCVNARAQNRTTIPIRSSDRCADSMVPVRIRVGKGMRRQSGVNGSVGATSHLSFPRFLPSSWRTLTDAMSDALGYIRVSSEEQADSGLGLEAHRQRISAYCALKELHLAEVFEDPGISSGKPLASRPAGSKLLATANKSKGLVIAVISPSAELLSL